MEAVLRRRSNRLRCVVVLLLGALASACGGPASRLHSHMERGRTYFDKGDYAHASVEFRNAAQIDPKDVDARVMMARVSEKLGQLRQAVSLYQNVIDQAPQTVEARIGLGRLFVMAGTPKEALDIVQPGLTQHPDNPGLLTIRALAKSRQDDTQGALADVGHALELDPNNEDAIALRAGFYRNAGDLPAAIKLVSDAVQRLPKSTDLREVLVQLYASTNDVVQTQKALQGLIDLRPADLSYRRQLAKLYAREHKVPEARATLEQAVAANATDNEAKLLLIDFVNDQQTPAAAEQLVRTYLAKDPHNFALRFKLAEMVKSAGDSRQAIEIYQDVIRSDGTGPQGLAARDRLATIYAAASNDAEARRLVAEVLSKSPRDEQALLIKGELAMKDQDAPAAIGYLRAVLRDNPQSVAIQRLLAHAYEVDGQMQMAEESLRAAVTAAPQDTAIRTELGSLLLAVKKPEQAVKLMEDTVRADPSDAAARETLIRAYLVVPNLEAARTASEDLKTLKPDSPAGFYYAGLAAEGLHRPDEAEQNYERGLALSPQAIDLLTAIVRLDMARNRFPHAADVLKAALARDPRNVGILNLQGEFYLARKDVPHAVETLQSAVALAPAWWPTYRNLALVKLAGKDEEGAIATYRAGIEAAPRSQALAVDLASFYERRGKIDAAIDVYKQWNRRNPRVADIENNLALLLVNHRNDTASLDEAKSLTAGFTDSTNSSYLDTRGWVHFKRAEYADALRVLEQAARGAPQSSEIRFHLGMTEAQLGRNDRARSDLEAAVSGAGKAWWSDQARSALASLKDRSG